MKTLSEQDHYEALELSRDAQPEDVDRAYRIASATYAPDSLAGYSVFEDGELEALRGRIELAYRTLADPEARRAYDREIEASEERPAREEKAAPPAAAAPAARPAPRGLLEGFDEDHSEGEWSGGRLRRARLQDGVEIGEIAKTTKVNPTYLEFIEQERFAELPAAVYVRGFVMGYASCIGLDPARVAASYMRRYEEHHGGRRRRLFSRR